MVKGKKHLSKDEIEERRQSEVQPCADGITAPAYLTAAQKKEFKRIAGQLQKIKIMGETDCDTLARYITAQTLYEKAVKDLSKIVKDRPNRDKFADDSTYYEVLDSWYRMQEAAAKLQDRFFKQAQTSASSLGLTISSRCKLVVPVKEEPEKVNKFARFGASGGGSK